jgi:hypothetical protein
VTLVAVGISNFGVADLTGLLFEINAAFAIKLLEITLDWLNEAGWAEPKTLPVATFKKTGFELTIIPKDLALLARFCGDLSESTCCWTT